MMKRFVFCLLFSSSLWAGEPEDIKRAIDVHGEETQKITDQAQDTLQKSFSDVDALLHHPQDVKSQDSFFGVGISQPPLDAERSCQSCQSQSLETLAKRPKQKSLKEVSMPSGSSSKELIVFVSLSMPNASLQQLALEAQQVGARLVIQGLINNSFQQTTSKIQALGIPLEIDSPLFELFEVTRVPTFVRCKITSEGATVEGHDRLTGNISLLAAFDKFQSLGELS